MNLYDYILSEFEYDREVASMFCSVFEYREEPKDKLLVKQGNLSHNVIFFENGLARTCYRKGSKDITHFFYGEGTFYLSTEVVFLKRDNIFDIQTLEKCCMRVTQFDKLRQLADRNPKIYHFILLGYHILRFLLYILTATCRIVTAKKLFICAKDGSDECI